MTVALAVAALVSMAALLPAAAAGAAAATVTNPAGGIAPGTSIGTAWPPLQGGTTYTQTLNQTEDWYILYKKNDSAGGSIRIVNTTAPGSVTCDGIYAYLLGVNGTDNVINDAALSGGQAFTFTVPGFETGDIPQGRYYVRISPWCTSGPDSPDGQTYTIKASPAGEWENPARVPVKAPTVGTSIGTAWPPLQGHFVYSNTLNNAEDWYILYKKNDSAGGSIRIVNTTVTGSVACDGIYAYLFGVNGTYNVVNDVALGNNQAFTFTVPGFESGDIPQGRYYVRISPWCTSGPDSPDGQTYSIEPEPTAEWANPARVPFGSVPPTTSLGSAWPPLRGGAVYPGTLHTTGDWYALYKKHDATGGAIRIVNTTVNGSVTCDGIYVYLFGAGGVTNVVNDMALGNNQAVTFTVPGFETGDIQGRYYVRISPWCTSGPDSPDSQTYTIEPEPAGEWGNGPSAALPSGPTSKTAAGPLKDLVDYLADLLKDGAKELWSYFTTKGAATVRVQDTSPASAGCKLVVKVGTSTSTLSAGQVITVHIAKAGRYTIELSVASSCTPKSTLTALIELTGSVRGPALTVTDPTLKTGAAGKAYSATIDVTGGKKPYAFTAVTALPRGLTLNSKTGVVTGRPVKAGSYTVLVTIKDSAANTVTVPIKLTIT